MLRGFVAAAAMAGMLLAGGVAAQEPVKIGYAISKTGQFAPAAASQLSTYEFWAQQIEAQGGLDVAGERRPVEWVVYDDQSDFSKGPTIYEKLITDDEVDLLLAPWGTPFHFAIAGVLERYQFPVVGNSAASVGLREVEPGNIWFPTAAIPDQIGAELVKLMQAEGVESVAINTLQLPFSQEIKQFLMPALEGSGIEVVVNEEYAPGTKDMTATLTAIKQAEPDAIVSLSYPPDSILYMNQSRELGIEAPFQLVMIGPTADFFGKMFGAARDGLITVGHWTPEKEEWAGARDFYEGYKDFTGEEPDYLNSALAYMSLEILEQAVAEVGLDKDGLRDYISSRTHETINGPVKFEGVQNVTTPTMFLQFQDGDAQIVWPPEAATADFMPKPAWR
ncbi:MAG: amino acid ABC transporter substrate-binding protein [Rhodovibrionaceae bacterium]